MLAHQLGFPLPQKIAYGIWNWEKLSLKEFKHEIRLTTYEKFFQRDLLKVLNTRTPLEEFVYPPPPAEPDPAPEELESENPQQHHADSAPPANQEPSSSGEISNRSDCHSEAIR